MATITQVTKITGWKVRQRVDALGDTSGMVPQQRVATILGGRPAIVSGWFDEATGNGFEVAEITLHAGEV